MNTSRSTPFAPTLRLLVCASVCAWRVWAAGTSEVVVANIATRGFDVFVRTPAPPAVCALQVFLDYDGTVAAEDVAIERQPLTTGPTVGDDYARRCAERLSRASLTAAGNTLFRVTDAEPDTPYFIRVAVDGTPWPDTGLHEVHTLPAAEWRVTTHQLVVDVSRPGDGWVGTLAAPGAVAPLLAVCGDGTPTNTSFFFNLADLADTLGAPYTPAPGALLDFRLYGRAGALPTQRALVYAAPSSNDAAVATLTTELTPLLRLLIASAVQTVCEPAPGDYFYFGGEEITCRLTQTVVTQVDTQLVAYGWSGAGDVPVSGRTTAFTFLLNTDSTVDWRWRTNFWVEVVADHGTVDLASGWYRSGAGLAATATPDAEWLFREWSGLAGGSDPLTAFTVTAPGALQAGFDPVLAPGGGGMPEWWLTQSGLVGADRASDADPDGDGMSNASEWQADTSPTNRLSDLRITAMAKNGGTVNLTWRGGREARQIVEMLEDNLAAGAWKPFTTNLPPTDLVGTCNVQLEGKPRVFFRIRAER